MAICALNVIDIKGKDTILNTVLIYTLFRFLIDSSILSSEQVNEYVFFACMAIWAFVNLIFTIDVLRIIVKGLLSFSLFMI